MFFKYLFFKSLVILYNVPLQRDTTASRNVIKHSRNQLGVTVGGVDNDHSLVFRNDPVVYALLHLSCVSVTRYERSAFSHARSQTRIERSRDISDTAHILWHPVWNCVRIYATSPTNPLNRRARLHATSNPRPYSLAWKRDQLLPLRSRKRVTCLRSINFSNTGCYDTVPSRGI